MTNQQYITKSLDGLNVSGDDIEIIMAKANINAEDTADAAACDMAIYNRFSIVLKAATQNVSEGGYSVSWNIEAVKMFYNALCVELGQENVLDSQPVIRDCSNIW